MTMHEKIDPFDPNRKTGASRLPSGKLLLACTAAVLLLPGCSFSLLPKEEQIIAPPLVQPAPPQYSTAKVVKKTIIQSVHGTANFIAVGQVNLSFKNPPPGGRISAINAKSTDHVKQGDVLVQLDPGDLNYSLQVAQLGLQSDQLTLNATLQKADATAIEQAKIKIQTDQLNINKIQQQITNCNLVSPMDGVVLNITTKNIGDAVSAYENVATVVDPAKLQLIYTAASADAIGSVDIGMSVTVNYKGQSLQGQVIQTPRSISTSQATPQQPNSQNLYSKSVIISIDKVPNGAKIGDTADIQIILQQKDNALVIPIDALGSYLGNSFVQTLTGESKKQATVSVGIKNDTEVEILSGVKEGDTVIKKN
ncbi:MAG: efflux transporter periplasmic adaptor subunit [Bacilli bacterium]|nr:efflux transporter periplasmic adaptor subunit [Bacilli bacterium]